MKLAYLSSSALPSSTANSIHVMKMCQAFAHQGHTVQLFAPRRRGDTERSVDETFDFYGVERGFQINKIGWGLFGYSYAWQAALAARRSGPDVAYGRYLPACYFSAALGLPVIYEAHGPAGSSPAYGWITARLMANRSLLRLVVISNPLRQLYHEQYALPLGKIMVAHNGADEPTTVPNLPDSGSERLRVGYVGHLYAGRGMEIIRALAERLSWADFHIVGGTPEDSAYWRAEFSGLSNVTFHGFVPPSETDAFRLSCDVLLSPYHINAAVHGGNINSTPMSPLKLFEYMAAGKAIICSDLPILQEILTDNWTALLCPSEDVDCWSKSLERLRDKPAFRKQLGERALSVFREKFSWRQRARRVLDDLEVGP